MAKKKKLAVVSDDFGMCPAVNDGIVQAFTDGVLTDTNLMAPCPSFDDACKLALEYSIPCGMHAVTTCDWDIYRWGPLTDAPSLIDATGNFRDSVEAAWAVADENEALLELEAQYGRIVSAGIEVTHIGEHMGVDSGGKMVRAMAAISGKHNVPHKGQWVRDHSRAYHDEMAHYAFTSCFCVYRPTADLTETKAELKEILFNLADGYHMWVIHAAVDHPSLDELCSPDFPAYIWSRPYRVVDFTLATDPEVKDWMDELEIELAPLSNCPRSDTYTQ